MKASKKKSNLLQRFKSNHSFSRDCTFKHSKAHCRRFSVCTGGTPFYVHEVIDQGGEPIKVQEYFGVGRVTEFRYGIKVRALICKPFKESIPALLKRLQIRALGVSLCGIKVRARICKPFKGTRNRFLAELNRFLDSLND
jgi:hypothetical protein